MCCLVLRSNFALLLTIQFVSLISSLINIINLLLTTFDWTKVRGIAPRSHTGRPRTCLVVCGIFSVAAELCILSSCWGWGRLLLSLFWCDCSAIFLGPLRFSAMCHAAGYPSGVPHLADSGWLTSSCSGGFAWGWGCSCYSCPVTPLWFSTLCQRSSPFRCFPFGVLRPCRVRQHV